MPILQKKDGGISSLLNLLRCCNRNSGYVHVATSGDHRDPSRMCEASPSGKRMNDLNASTGERGLFEFQNLDLRAKLILKISFIYSAKKKKK